MKSPLVVGYKGEIGRFILQGLLYMAPKANNIWCVDVNDSDTDISERIAKSDTIFLCVPMKETVGWLRKWRTQLKDKLIVEQTSLKSVLYDNAWFKKNSQHFNILSMHILFKPSATPDPQDRMTILIEKEKWDDNSGVLGFNLANTIQLLCNSCISCYRFWQEHDQAMAVHQALTHRVIINLDHALTQQGSNVTYLGQQVRLLANRIKAGNAEMYKTIQSNPAAKKVVKQFQTDLKGFKL